MSLTKNEKNKIQEKFEKWFDYIKKEDGDPYAENTKNKYKYALNSINKNMENDNSFSWAGNIYLVDNIDDIERLEEFLNNKDWYEKLNDAGDARAVLQLYKRFIKDVIVCYKYCTMLEKSRNIILRGAPGTGKTYLARQIAAYIISDEETTEFQKLTEEQLKRFEFVQFHPGYDYADFVEGLRPQLNDKREMFFSLIPGKFSAFVQQAKEFIENIELSQTDNSKKSLRTLVCERVKEFIENEKEFTKVRGGTFKIDSIDNDYLYIVSPDIANSEIILSTNILERLLKEKTVKFNKPVDIRKYVYAGGERSEPSYFWPIYKELTDVNEIKNYGDDDSKTNNIASDKMITQDNTKIKKFVFIIDEINRGEISKIFGELFYSIDPGCRGKKEEGVKTQYSDMHNDPAEKFYIPDNVYIIGTMNDIDRSVDTFDFAMRRRFRFIEIKAEDQAYILDGLTNDLSKEAKKRMSALNEAIENTLGLNRNYDIGPAYFLKLKEMDFDALWSDCLEPLLRDYVQGMDNEEELIETYKKAYNGV